MTQRGRGSSSLGTAPTSTAAELRAGIAHEADPREAIRDYLMQSVESGKVKDRPGVVAALQRAGLDVPRQGTHYVTAHDPESGKRWRLKGTLYEHDFQRERFTRPDPAPDGDRGPGDERARGARAADVWRDVARTREAQAAYHRDRYGDRDRADSRAASRAARAAVARLARGPGDRGEHLAHHLRRELGADAVAVDPRAESARDAGDPAARDRPDTDGARPAAGGNVGRVAPRGRERDAVRGAAHAGR